MTPPRRVRAWRAAALLILLPVSFALGGCGQEPAGSGPHDEEAAAGSRENGQASAETDELVEELSTDADLLEMQATRVEESEIPLITGGTEVKEEQVREMSVALEDLRGASETYVEEDDPFCTELPNLPVDTTKQEPPSVAVSDVEQLRGQIGDARADLADLEGANRNAPGDAGAEEAKEEAGEALERAEEVEGVASEALDEWEVTEKSVRTEIMRMEKEAEEIEEGLGC